jgi:hypothetical protein
VIAIVAIVGVVGILVLAMKGNIDAGSIDTTVPVADVPDAVGQSVPSNSGGEYIADNASDFQPGVKVAINPADQDTWPGGDAIWDVARAIAVAEGYGPAQNNPTKLCNPGDISDGASQFGYEDHSGSKVTHFPDHETGWNWLYNKLANIQAGGSKVYSNNMSWTQFAHTYAGNWQAWCNNVTRELHVAPTDRVGDYWNA